MAPVLLIYCEGKTEKLYFEILSKRIFRIPMYVRVDVYGEKGQHKALIDRVSAARLELANEEGLEEDEIECWAVCDDDNMPFTYKELSPMRRKTMSIWRFQDLSSSRTSSSISSSRAQ